MEFTSPEFCSPFANNIVANNSQSSDYGLCHNYTTAVQQVIFVQTKLLWKTEDEDD